MASSGGKVILCGEHAVVYGGDAVAIGLPCGVEARAATASAVSLAINGKELDASELATEALRRLLQGLSLPPTAISLDLSMPVGVGLGASAAMAVAVTRTVAELYQRPCDIPTLLKAAQDWERVFHGNPSGVDAACAALGGCISYNRVRGAVRVPVGAALHLAIAVASPASLTKHMIEQVASIREHDPIRFARNLNRIQQLVEQAREAVSSGAHALLGALLNENHALLCEWGLSTPGIEAACDAARAAGAFGSKLTGAGGGGCVLAICSGATQGAVVSAWKRLSLQTLTSCIEPGGVDVLLGSTA